MALRRAQAAVPPQSRPEPGSVLHIAVHRNEGRWLIRSDSLFNGQSATFGYRFHNGGKQRRETHGMATTANRKTTALKEAMTKTQLLNTLSESTGLQRKDVAAVLDQLGAVIERHVRKRAVGTFTLPGLLKIKVVHKPATKARKMMSPFTGQEITVAAKPASRAVKVQPLSALKRMTE